MRELSTLQPLALSFINNTRTDSRDREAAAARPYNSCSVAAMWTQMQEIPQHANVKADRPLTPLTCRRRTEFAELS
jgi:hypothetical protein